MGRNEVQKNKSTPYCLAEFHGESEKNSRFSPREPSFRAKRFLKKWLLKRFIRILAVLIPLSDIDALYYTFKNLISFKMIPNPKQTSIGESNFF